MCSQQSLIDITTLPPGFFFSFIFGRLVCWSSLSSQTAIGIFFLSFDAQVRGTGDVVNSLKSEGGRGLEEGLEGGCVSWLSERDSMTFSCVQRWRHQSCFLVTAHNHSRQLQSKT